MVENSYGPPSLDKSSRERENDLFDLRGRADRRNLVVVVASRRRVFFSSFASFCCCRSS